MGVWVTWDNPEKTILRYIYEETWTWDEWGTAVEDARTMMQSVDHKVFLIVDAACRDVPKGALSRFRHATCVEAGHVKMVLLVGNNAFLQTLFSIVRRLVQGCAMKLVTVATLDDAYQIIQQQQMLETNRNLNGA